LYSDAHKAALARKLGINNSRTEIDEVLRSDFARAFNSAYGAQASAALLTQYRMAPPIGDLVSKTFYDRKLLNGERAIPDVYQHAPEALRSVVTWLILLIWATGHIILKIAEQVFTTDVKLTRLFLFLNRCQRMKNLSLSFQSSLTKMKPLSA
jgi:hypothetical protein